MKSNLVMNDFPITKVNESKFLGVTIAQIWYRKPHINRVDM